MLSSSGGDGRNLSQKPSTNKIKNNRSDSEWKHVDYSKNRKSKTSINTSKPSSPISPSLKQILDNPPTLCVNTNNQNFDYENTESQFPLSTDINVPMTTDDNCPHGNTNSTDNTNYGINCTKPVSSNSNITDPPISQTFTYTKPNIQQHSKCFSADYNGPPVIIIESTDPNSGTGIWHPLKCAKFFSNNFFGINNIKPNGHKKIKIIFDSAFHANTCLESPLLQENKLSAYIPSTLIFSHGIIKLDTAFPVEDFWDGIKSEFEIVAFKRISTNKDGKITPTRIVELKFLSCKIPKCISIYNMLFEVSPSIRSPLQCKNCLRFGHTSKFCRSSPKCSHCGSSKHSIESCPTSLATDPCCLYCQLPHLATDRSCREWKSQQDLKKIMATENLSFRDAVIFKKQIQVTSAFSYSNIVSNQPRSPSTKTAFVPHVFNSIPTSPPLLLP